MGKGVQDKMIDLSRITFQDIVNFAAACIVLFEFGKWLISFGNPIVELKKRVDEHDDLFQNDKDHLDRIDDAVGRIDEGVIVLGKALNELLRHQITGNDVEALKDQQKKVNDYFYGE